MVRALLSATLPKRGCCQPSEPSCQRNFTFKKCQDKEIDGWFRAAGAGLIAWVKVRGQGWLQLLAPGGRILPGLLPAQGSAAARRGGRKEKLVLWFKATLLAWHFHCFHLFFHCISVAARGTSFLTASRGTPLFPLSPPHYFGCLSEIFFPCLPCPFPVRDRSVSLKVAKG